MCGWCAADARQVPQRHRGGGDGDNAAMLYKFKSAASGDLIMLGPHGDELMRVLGREPAARGIIDVEAMAESIARIKAAVAADEARREQARRELARPEGDEPAEDDAAVPAKARLGLRQRLWPMLQMLERSLAERVPVVWGV
jgi:Domain of unknown function (DUF1840)